MLVYSYLLRSAEQVGEVLVVLFRVARVFPSDELPRHDDVLEGRLPAALLRLILLVLTKSLVFPERV